MSHTYRSTIKGDNTTITVDETIDQLAEPGNWEEVAKVTAAEKKAAKAEADRLAALPVHVGDTVKLNEAALASALEEPEATAEALDKATAWRGVVSGVRHDEEAEADFAEFEGETPDVPVAALEVAEPAK